MEVGIEFAGYNDIFVKICFVAGYNIFVTNWEFDQSFWCCTNPEYEDCTFCRNGICGLPQSLQYLKAILLSTMKLHVHIY